MYIPKYFREDDRREILSFLRHNNFAAIVSYDGRRPVATHTPVEVVADEAGGLTVFGHIARGNPQGKTFAGQEVLLIFQGAHTYISPRWYNHTNVPTWNYMTVHLYGTLREVQGEELHALLSRLVATHEANSSYRLESLPAEYVAKEIRGVYGFAVQVTQVEAAYKLSQNRNDEDHANIIQELGKRSDEDSHQVARAMQKKRGDTLIP